MFLYSAGAVDSLSTSVTASVTATIALIVGFLAGIFVYHCISNHQSQICKPSSHQQQQAAVAPLQQTGPEYEEVVELRQNRAYELTQNIDVRANMSRNQPQCSMPESSYYQEHQGGANYDESVPATSTGGKIEMRANVAYEPIQH